MGLALLFWFSVTVQPYDIIDPRFCYLTPQPFVCEKCLRNGQEFARFLQLKDGILHRSYACYQRGRKNRLN